MEYRYLWHWGGKDKLLAQLKESECGDIIEFKGFSKHINYNDYAFMVVPSRFEGFSMAIVESLAKGVPVVSFDCPEGPGVLLRNGVGELIPAEDTDLLAKGILKMANDRELRIEYAQKGLERAKEYSQHVITDKWIDLLRSFRI